MRKSILMAFLVTLSLGGFAQGSGSKSFTFQDLERWWGGKGQGNSGSGTTVQSGLDPGQSLLTDEKLYSPNGAYYLHMQPDGNLCIYSKNKGFVWGTMVYGFENARLTMQEDGNLVVEEISGNEKIFRWGSYQSKPYVLAPGLRVELTNSGKLQIVDTKGKVVWTN